METIRFRNSQRRMISSAFGVPFEENETLSFPDQWLHCIFWMDGKHMQDAHRP